MSAERMRLPRGIVAMRPLGAAPAPGPAEGARCVPMSPPDLKEIQLRAFERGRACERAALAEKLGGLLAALAGAVQAVDAMRSKEREDLARFGVELAVSVAEEIAGASIRKGTHDVRRLVDALLEEAMPGLGQGPLHLAVHPADLDALGDLAAGKDARTLTARIHLVADPELARGACRIRAGGAEILADPKMRLAAIAERLRAVAERPDA